MTAPVDLVVRGGTVADSRWQGPADIFVSDGRVRGLVEPGTPLPVGSKPAIEINATGKLVLPGGVDPHCHVGFTSGDFTSLDDYRECTTAAVMGGTTTIVDFAIPRSGQAPIDAAYHQRAKADQGVCDSALHASVVRWDASTADQLRSLTREGIVTVKMFTTYRGESMADDDTILKTMSTLRDLGGMVVAHCEANHIIEDAQRRCGERDSLGASHMAATRPELAETASVASVLATAEAVGAAVYFVHQSTAEAVEQVARARRRGVQAFSETVAHHLLLDDSLYAGDHPERFVCCPPLRRLSEVRELSRHLFTGEIDTIGSDHCCYDLAQKQERGSDVRVMPNGLPGVETRLATIFSSYVLDQGLPVTRFVELTATNPARANGLYPRKGSLLPGADADIAIWDPRETWTVSAGSAGTLHQATDYTPYEGRQVTGRPRTVLVRGQVVVDDGVLVDAPAQGRHVQAQPLVFGTRGRG